MVFGLKRKSTAEKIAEGAHKRSVALATAERELQEQKERKRIFKLRAKTQKLKKQIAKQRGRAGVRSLPGDPDAIIRVLEGKQPGQKKKEKNIFKM